MKLSDLGDLDKEDILSALGLASKPTSSERFWGGWGVFAVGVLVGAGAALLLAPKTGRGLREDLGERFRRGQKPDAEDVTEPPAAEARS